MEYKPFYDTVTLEGPEEIRPTLRALGDTSLASRTFGPDAREEVTSEFAFVASQNLIEDSWKKTISYEEGAKMRDLAERLAVAAMRAKYGDEEAVEVDGLRRATPQPTYSQLMLEVA